MQWFGRFGCQMLASVMVLSAVGSALFAPSAVAQDQLRGRVAAAVGTDQPALVVSLTSMSKLTADVAYVAEQLGQGQFGGMFTMLATSYTQGIDPARPTGIFVHLVDGNPEPIAVLPTSDAAAILKRLETNGMIPPADKLDDGTLVVAAGPVLIYIRQAGPWAVIARTPDLLAKVPADPLPLLDGLGSQFDLAFRVNIQQVPIELREMLVDQITQGFDQAMAQQAQSGDAQMSLSNAQLEQLQQVIRESERLQFGINIDPARREVLFQTIFTAVPGSELAEMTNASQPIPSKFSAVLQGDTAVRYHSAASISPKAADSAMASLEIVSSSIRNMLDTQTKLSEADKAEIEELTAELMTIMGKSIAEGKQDIGVMGLAGADTLKLAGGLFVHDGAEFAAWLRKVAAKIPAEAGAPKFSFDVGKYKDISLHSVTLDVPADKADARRLFGDKLELIVGTAPKAIYFAFGQGSQPALRVLVDTADTDKGNLQERGLGQMRVKLLPFLELAHSIKPDDAIAALIEEVSKQPTLDTIQINAFPISNGQKSSVIISEGILRAIGVGIREAQAAKMREMQRGSGF